MYGGTVDVLYPACGVDGGTGLGLDDEGLGIQRDLAFDVHALGIGVLLVAGIHGHPGVGLVVDGASTGDVVHECFDPDVFEFDEFDLAAGCQADVGDAALPHELFGSFGFGDAAYPVHGTVSRYLDGAVDVAGGDVCCAQEADEEAGGVEAVTLLGLQGHIRTLDGAVGGEGFDGVSDLVVDLRGVVVQAGGQGLDCGGEGDVTVKKYASPVALARQWRIYLFLCIVGLHFIHPNRATPSITIAAENNSTARLKLQNKTRDNNVKKTKYNKSYQFRFRWVIQPNFTK